MPKSAAARLPQHTATLELVHTAEPPVPVQPDPAAALAAVRHTDDVVEYTLRCVLALAPGLSEHLLAAADRQVRGLFGRSSIYIATRKGEGRAARNEAIRREYARGERVPYLARRYQLTERMIWAIVRADEPAPGAD